MRKSGMETCVCLSQEPGPLRSGWAEAKGRPLASFPGAPVPANSCSSSYCLCHFTPLGLSFPMCGVVVVSP